MVFRNNFHNSQPIPTGQFAFDSSWQELSNDAHYAQIRPLLLICDPPLCSRVVNGGICPILTKGHVRPSFERGMRISPSVPHTITPSRATTTFSTNSRHWSKIPRKSLRPSGGVLWYRILLLLWFSHACISMAGTTAMHVRAERNCQKRCILSNPILSNLSEEKRAPYLGALICQFNASDWTDSYQISPKKMASPREAIFCSFNALN